MLTVVRRVWDRRVVLGGWAVLVSVVLLWLGLVPVDASVGEALLSVPLFEVGTLWLNAWRAAMTKLVAAISSPNLGHPLTYAALAALTYVTWKLYQIFFASLDRVRMLGDLGYIPEGKLTMKEMVNEVRRSRQVGDCPPVYPNGWFAVIESRDLKVKQSKTVSMLGLQLAVFRAADGCVHVIDAYCPHLGANLGVGGQVKGNCIECPFHGWLFRGDDGKCVEIPYSRETKIPDVARVKSYTVLERNGFVYMWYHAEGMEPYWEPPEIEEITTGQWKYRGRTEHIINCHIEDIPENGADVAHLPQVHGPIMTSGIDLRYTYNKMWSFGKHHWDGYWTASTKEGEKHIGTLALTHTMSLFGIHIPLLDMHVRARQIGPGIVYLMFHSALGSGVYLHNITPLEPLKQRMVHQMYFIRYVPVVIPKFFLLAEALMIGPGIVYLFLDSPIFGKGAFLQLVTPRGPITQRMIHHIYLNTWAPTIVAKVFLVSEAMMVERDIMIWNNKRYEGKPVLVKSDSDSLLTRHRRWYSQFYSEHSPRLHFHKDSLDW